MEGVLVLTFISLIYTVISSFKQTQFAITPYIFVIRFVHIFVLIFHISYIFLFDTRYDILYLVYTIFLYGHWSFFNNECILNILEKQHYGTETTNIYLYIVFGDYTDIILMIAAVLSLINLIIVVNRQEYIPIHLKLIFIVICLIIITLSGISKHTHQSAEYPN